MINNAIFSILIVDDTPTNIRFLELVLKKEKYNTFAANSGEQAFEILKENNIHLILLDIVMPGEDGYEVCKKIKKNKETRDIPVIFITSNNKSESIVKGFQVGGQDYITKPFNIPELLERMKTHLLLKKKSDEVNHYVNELIALNRELLKLNTQLDSQNQIIEKKNKDLTDSMAYARLLQKAILSPASTFQKVFPHSFIFLKPKDIVSGDFFLIEWKENNIFFGAIDCTGHGVPGALMSIVAKNTFDHAIYIQNLQTPADILNHLSVKLKIDVNQDTDAIGLRDGMDAALCHYNTHTKELLFSSAKSSIIHIRNNEIFEYRTNENAIGLAEFGKQQFQNMKIDINPNDLIYLFSDGFYDQVGGEKEKKFSKKQFKELLLSISQKPFQQQKQILTDTFEQWRGNIEQYDDVLVMGIAFDEVCLPDEFF